MAAISASGDKARAVELDTRVRFLRSACEATRIQFTEDHIGLAGADHIAAYHNSAESFRHRRAAILLRARLNHLVGAKIGRQLSEAATVRCGEVSMRNLGRVDVALAAIQNARVAA
jgi:hypothetical protein